MSAKPYILFAVFLVLLSSESYSQQPPVSDQYILNPLLINPAHAGSRGALNFAALYRRQWAGLKGAPETIMLTSDMPVAGGKPGIGFSITTDKIGVTRENAFSTYYSYKIQTGAGDLSFGLKAGLLTTKTNWSELEVLDPGDDLFMTDSRVFVMPDFSYGMYFSTDDFFAGFSIPRLLGYKFNYEENKYSIKVNPGQYYYLFNAGYLFTIAPDIQFLPSTLLSVSPGEKILLDLNAHFVFSEKVWVGASYRSNNSIAGMLQFSINRQLKFAYVNYYDFNKLGRFSNGTHEIMLRYEFLYKADIVNPLIF